MNHSFDYCPLDKSKFDEEIFILFFISSGNTSRILNLNASSSLLSFIVIMILLINAHWNPFTAAWKLFEQKQEFHSEKHSKLLF